MGTIKERMKQDLELRNYAPNTRRAYLRIAEALVRHFMIDPREMGEREVRTYLLNRSRHLKPSTLAVEVAAIKFLFEVTLDRPEVAVRIPIPKVTRTLPDTLTGSEVVALLAAVESLKHRAILTVTYGAGLRVSEACALKPEDIDSKRMVIKVRNAKGAKDRYVMLAETVLHGLREYYKAERPAKPWLFPGQHTDHHIGVDAVREALRKAVKAVGLNKRVTPHVLRHAFATHLVESGTDIYTVQVLLGHSSIRSTQFYTRLSTAHLARTKSPLDQIGTEQGEVLG